MSEARSAALFLVTGMLLLAGLPAGAESVGVRAQAVGAVTGERTGLSVWLPAAREALAAAAVLDDEALAASGAAGILRAYLDHYEPLEAWYGPGGAHGVEPLASAVSRGERGFHALLQADGAAAMRARLVELRATLDTVAQLAQAAAVPGLVDAPAFDVRGAPQGLSAQLRVARTPEIAGIVASVRAAEERHAAGDDAGALQLVEAAYLQAFETLEPRLPRAVAREVESLIHLRLRPQLARSAPPSEVRSSFVALHAGLAAADVALAGGTTFWFGAVNAFVIIVREGLEAVLLIAAMVAYLSGSRAPKRETARIYAGAGLGVLATAGTWLAARTFIPVTGAGRELMEGVTALVAVGVLLWVSHWLFQKAYLRDWKAYLRTKVGEAVTTGSALAMAGLAFAAVYREGFETVLFYQALAFDASRSAVLAGFLPGLAFIAAFGVAVLRLGVRLPLRTLFAITNGILLYLAFVFLGKGIYNLQEAGIFAPRPIGWLPDHGVLRQVFGLYPLAETLLAQAAFLTLLMATWVFYLMRRRSASAG